jgi:predicted DCC family thiol-disulfide oxidoreductase YuxK
MPQSVVTVIYDGECGICEALKRRAEALDARQRLQFAAYQTVDLDALAPGLTAAEASRAVIAVRSDGRTWRGARAFFTAMKHLPGIWGKIGAVGAVPAVSWLAEPAYRLVAARRGQISRWLGLNQCQITPSRHT